MIVEYINDDSKLMQEYLLLKGPFYFLIGETIVYLIILVLIEIISPF